MFGTFGHFHVSKIFEVRLEVRVEALPANIRRVDGIDGAEYTSLLVRGQCYKTFFAGDLQVFVLS